MKDGWLALMMWGGLGTANLIVGPEKAADHTFFQGVALGTFVFCKWVMTHLERKVL